MTNLWKERILVALCLCAGAMDAMSGALLMFWPEGALRMMSVPPVVTEALVFNRFIGAFVFSVGCLYVFSLLPVLTMRRWHWVWGVLAATAWLRAVICVFTSIAIVGGALSVAWWTVPVTDGVLAVVQVWILLKGWVPRNV